MEILAIETTGPFSSVALLRPDGKVEEAVSDRLLSHLQDLVPKIEGLLSDCKLSIGDITHIAVSEGPGSFTGIRIGMATAKALAQVLTLPLIPVPTLKAFAWNLPGEDGLVCPVLDARRSQVYAGAYRRRGEQVEQLLADGAYSIEEFCRLVKAAGGEKEKALWFGDGLAVYGQAILESAPEDGLWTFAPQAARFQKASSAVRLAHSLLAEGRTVSVEELRPVYLRKAEAERKLEENQKAKAGQNQGPEGSGRQEPSS
ncbi:MAG: tRNA (adenosine(37)-N6)-threonylcarbamoyltransferase complex dimerization subunit type 1 TsaB [Bacillota bacterium]|nr:tRNA (adenosine(37)-N6)-threonylcarbamoyltransferase complex dimerization subunit type 1 TsaB [Bacillota bacterium]